MLVHETGTCSGSDLYFSTPSEYARRMLFYMSTCGYYYTNYDYRIEREEGVRLPYCLPLFRFICAP